LCLIGESFDEFSDEICGAVINIRPKGDKLGLWTRNASQRDANIKIGSFCFFVFISNFTHNYDDDITAMDVDGPRRWRQ